VRGSFEAEVADLTHALGEAAVEIRVWRKSAEGPAGPFEDLEVIRVEAGMSSARFCQVIDMPERTWRRWQGQDRAGGRAKGPWPRPARESASVLARRHASAHPAWSSAFDSAMSDPVNDGCSSPKAKAATSASSRSRIASS